MIPVLLTTISAPLVGTLAIGPATLDDAAVAVTLSWDISAHADGNTASMQVDADISLDGGVTWQFLCGAGRDKGYAPLLDKQGLPMTMASISCQLPLGVARQVRARLSSSSSVTTFIKISQS